MRGVSVLVFLCIVCLSNLGSCVYYDTDELFAEVDTIPSVFEIEVDSSESKPRQNVIIVTRGLEPEQGVEDGFLYPGVVKGNDKDQTEFDTPEDNDINRPQEITIEKLSDKLDSLISQVKAQEDKITELEEANKILQDKVDLVEQQTKTNSAIFFNVPESEHEGHTSTLLKVLHVIRMMKVSVTSNDIAVALRADSNFTQDRPIVVSFTNFATKMKVLGATNNLRHSKITVVGDYSEQVAKKRSQLLPYMHDARRQGYKSFLLYDKLVVNGVKMTLEQLQAQSTLDLKPQQFPEATQDPKEQVEEVEVDPPFDDHEY